MKKILLIIVVIVIIGTGGWILWKNKKTILQPKTATSEVAVAGKFQEPKTDSQNGVEIVVTPSEVVIGKQTTYAVSFTAHEGDLDIDLVKSSTLEVDGKIFRAKSWDGGSGGHHLSGNLVFSGFEKEPTKMILRMENIAGANRTFTWQ